jgi:hypothetical protein
VETGFSESIDSSKGMYFDEDDSSSGDTLPRYELVRCFVFKHFSKVRISKMLENRIVTTTDKPALDKAVSLALKSLYGD